MIVALHGVPGLSFAELTYMLTDLGIGYMAVTTNKPTKIGDPRTDHVVPVVFKSARSFADHHAKIKFRSVAFICDSYHRLHVELKWPVIGVDVDKKGHRFKSFHQHDLGMLLQADDQLTTPVKVDIEFTAYDPTEKMVQKFEKSALSQSQTLMYRIKNQELRSKTFMVVREWFVGLIKSKDTLKGRIFTLHKNDKYSTDLLKILLSDHGASLRKAAIEGRAKPTRIDAICKKNKISPFDVRYLLSKGSR